MQFSASSSAFLFIISYVISYIFCLIYWKHKSDSKEQFSIVSFLLLSATAIPYALLCANRSDDTGFDTTNNIIGYFNMRYGIEYVNDGFNYLYQYLRYLALYVFGRKIEYWFFIVAYIPLICINYVFQKFARDKYQYALGCLLFSLYLSPIMMDQSRQFMAMGISTLAIYKLYNGNIKTFVIWTFICVFIHESCIFLFLLLLLYKFKYSRGSIYLIMVLMFVSVFLLQYLMSLLYLILPAKFSYIQEQGKEVASSGYAWIIDVIPMLLVVFIYYKNRKVFPLKDIPLVIYALSALPLRLAAYNSFFIMRLSYYGEIVSIILLLNILSHLSSKKVRFWSYVSFFVFFIHWYIDFVFLRLNDAIPYSYGLKYISY